MIATSHTYVVARTTIDCVILRKALQLLEQRLQHNNTQFILYVNALMLTGLRLHRKLICPLMVEPSKFVRSLSIIHGFRASSNPWPSTWGPSKWITKGEWRIDNTIAQDHHPATCWEGTQKQENTSNRPVSRRIWFVESRTGFHRDRINLHSSLSWEGFPMIFYHDI